MTIVKSKTIEKRKIPLRIWSSLKGLEPQIDFVIDPKGKKELVLAIEQGSLLTITRNNGAKNINHHERILIDYELHQMKPVRTTTYYERSYDSMMRAIYDCYDQMLVDAEVSE